MSTTLAPEATGQTACADRSDRSSPVRRTGPTGQTGPPDRSDRSNVEWLQQRLDQYRAHTNDICEVIEDSGDLDKLGQGFTSADPLEKIDIGWKPILAVQKPTGLTSLSSCNPSRLRFILEILVQIDLERGTTSPAYKYKG